MSVFNFPAGATNGQEYVAPNGTVYTFDGEKWNIKTSNLANVATSGDYTDLSNRPDLTFNIAGDDSTEREVNLGETVKFVGTNGITTTTDDEGNVTITGEEGIGIEDGQTYNINIVGDVFAEDSAKIIDSQTGIVTANVEGDVTGNITGDVKGSVFGDDSTPIVDATNNTLNGDLTGDTTGTHSGPVTGDVTGSIFADDSTQIIDAHSQTVTGSDLTTTNQNVYFGSPEVARTRVASTTSNGTNTFDFHLFRATEYRSMKIVLQATNTVTSEYYVSELLCLHDGSDSYTAEYARIFTSATPDIAVVALLNNGNFLLRITPAVADLIEYKFVIHTMTV